MTKLHASFHKIFSSRHNVAGKKIYAESDVVIDWINQIRFRINFLSSREGRAEKKVFRNDAVFMGSMNV